MHDSMIQHMILKHQALNLASGLSYYFIVALAFVLEVGQSVICELVRKVSSDTQYQPSYVPL